MPTPHTLSKNTLMPLGLVISALGVIVWLTTLFNMTNAKLDLLIETQQTHWTKVDQRLFALELQLLNPTMLIPTVREEH
jgi:hypothetical protein